MFDTRRHIVSIRRIVAGGIVLICIGINVLAVVYVKNEHELIEETITAMTSEQGQAWAELAKQKLTAEDVSGLQSVVDAIGNSESVLLAFVAGEDGRIVASTDRRQIRQRNRRSHKELVADKPHVEELHPEPEGFFHETGHTFELYFPIGENGRHLGSLTVHVNTAWGNQQAKALALRLLLLVFGLTCIIGLGAVALDWRLRKAVKSLISATQAIAEGERHPHFCIGTGDDLEVLGESVRQMAGALQNTEDRVRHWHRELEAVVEQRTRQLEKSQQLLAEKEKVAALGLMAAGIVHEVGNPLAAMSAIVQRIERTGDEKLKEKCRILGEQIERISKIVNEMRHVARPAASDGSATNVNEILLQTFKVIHFDPRAQRGEIVTRLDNRVPRIPGHPDRWQQVFLNLVMNALEAMPNGGELTVATAVVDDRVEITFHDNGRGMSQEEIRNLFHPFFTTKAAGRGMGLGLSVCHGIIRSYGGDIRVQSEPGRGSEFRISVPFQEEVGSQTRPESIEVRSEVWSAMER